MGHGTAAHQNQNGGQNAAPNERPICALSFVNSVTMEYWLAGRKPLHNMAVVQVGSVGSTTVLQGGTCSSPEARRPACTTFQSCEASLPPKHNVSNNKNNIIASLPPGSSVTGAPCRCIRPSRARGRDGTPAPCLRTPSGGAQQHPLCVGSRLCCLHTHLPTYLPAPLALIRNWVPSLIAFIVVDTTRGTTT